MPRNRWWVRSIYRGLVAVVLIGVLRLSLVNGWLRPIRARTGSMWPAVEFHSCRTTCGDCDYSFRWSSSVSLNDVVCPNCGFSNQVVAASREPGERLLVDRLPTLLWRPSRFQVVAVQTADEPEWAIKRVVGLPGEQLRIFRGDLYADKNLIQKSLAQLRQVAITVHDDRYRPRSSVLRRWRAEGAGWTSAEGGFEFQSPPQPTKSLLRYHHWLCVRNASPPVGRTEEVGIVDSYGTNQSISRSYYSVTDILFECRVETIGPSRLQISLASLEEPVTIDFQLDESMPGGLVVDAKPGSYLLEVAVCDGQVLVGLNRREVRRFDAQAVVPDHANGRPVAISGAGHFRITNLRIARDVYYLDPVGEDEWMAPSRLERDAYFVLGDNAPISVDSRQRSLVFRQSLIGVLAKYPFPQK